MEDPRHIENFKYPLGRTMSRKDYEAAQFHSPVGYMPGNGVKEDSSLPAPAGWGHRRASDISAVHFFPG